MSGTKTSITTYSEDELFYNPLLRFEPRLTELSHRIVPKQPYLITIPSDLPYRRSNHDPNLWYQRSPFSHREELLQYMSLLPHQHEDEELIRVEGDRIDQNDGELLARAPSPQFDVASRPPTPRVTGPKKKISLQDYKKDKSVANTPGDKELEDSLRRPAVKSNKEEGAMKPATGRAQLKIKNQDKTLPTDESTSRVDARQDRKSPHANSTQSGWHGEPPLKKRRLSPGTDSQDRALNARKHVNGLKYDLPSDKPLPDLLSPTLPVQRRKEQPLNSPRVRSRDLPALLSPRLPTDLEVFLQTPQKMNDVKVTSSKALPRSNADEEQVKTQGHPSVKSPFTTVRPPSSAKQTTTLDTVNSPVSQSRTASPRPRQRHRVILKYGKKNRKRVELILRMRPAKRVTETSVVDETETKEKPKLPFIKEPGNESVKAEKPVAERKRPPDVEVELPAKKQRTASNPHDSAPRSDRPSTPKPNIAKAAAPINNRTTTLLSTPQKEPPKPTAMRRVASSDTQGARTPQMETKPSTPAATGLSSQRKPSPAPASTPSSSADVSKWEELAARLHQQGRLLKREGNVGTHEAKTREKASTVIAQIEALLCFMLNTAANAQAHPHAPAQWHTIIPYHIQVWRYSRLYPHLHGLVVQLGAVLRQHLLQEQIRQLSKIHIVDDPIASAPTPSSDGTTRPSEDPTKTKKAFLDLRDELAQNARELRIAWLEGSRILPPELLESQYRHTWKRRSVDTSKRQLSEKLTIRDLQTTKAGFFLPLDPTTNCFEAASFASAFLGEWTKTEEVAWTSRVEL